MNEPDSVLEKLKQNNRPRAIVPKREDSLINRSHPKSEEELASKQQDTEKTSEQNSSQSEQPLHQARSMSESNQMLEKTESSQDGSSEPKTLISTNTSLIVEGNQSLASPSNPSEGLPIEKLKADLAKYPPTRRRSAIVLDEKIDDDLVEFCRKHKITAETFLEAAWVIANTDAKFKESILKEAKQRYSKRKEAGKLRRLISQLVNH